MQQAIDPAEMTGVLFGGNLYHGWFCFHADLHRAAFRKGPCFLTFTDDTIPGSYARLWSQAKAALDGLAASTEHQATQGETHVNH